MSTVCLPCAEPAVCLEGLDSYSLQDDVFHPIFICPPGQICGRNNFLFLLCCDGNQLRVDFTIGMTKATRDALINKAVAECEIRRAFCEPTTDCLVPPCEPEYFYSAPATCTVYCPDGTPFTYTVPAGVFLAKTFAEAQAAARAYACEQAPLQIFCLSPLVTCACSGTPFSVSIPASPSKPLKFVVAAGTFPPGLTFPTGVISSGVLVITGTPTVPGTYSFSIRAIDSDGNSMEKPYVLTISGITTTSIPNFTVGTPYSFQLQAVGLGTLTFGILSGSLPLGLELSSTGLISGTPTLGAVTSVVEFSLSDSACEEANPRSITPRARLSTSSLTRIETRIGWPEFLSGGTGDLYKTATYTGDITQIAFPNFNPDENLNNTQCAGAKYEYVGFDQIAPNGNVLSRHSKNVTLMCPNTTPGVWKIEPDSHDPLGAVITRLLLPSTLRGFCWDTNPDSCPSCDADDTTWAFAYDAANFGPLDYPNGILWGPENITTGLLNYDYVGLDTLNGGIIIDPGTVGFPTNTGFDIYTQGFPFVRLESTGDWGVVLSDPFTDADANSTAITFASLLSVAQNKSVTFVTNTLTHRQTTRTSVAYAIQLTNLVVGSVYIASVQLRSSTGATSVVSTSFTAIATTHVVTGAISGGSIPLNTTLTVRNPTVAFA